MVPPEFLKLGRSTPVTASTHIALVFPPKLHAIFVPTSTRKSLPQILEKLNYYLILKWFCKYCYPRYNLQTFPTNSPIRSSLSNWLSPCKENTKSLFWLEWKTINWSLPGLILIEINWNIFKVIKSKFHMI